MIDRPISHRIVCIMAMVKPASGLTNAFDFLWQMIFFYEMLPEVRGEVQHKKAMEKARIGPSFHKFAEKCNTTLL